MAESQPALMITIHKEWIGFALARPREESKVGANRRDGVVAHVLLQLYVGVVLPSCHCTEPAPSFKGKVTQVVKFPLQLRWSRGLLERAHSRWSSRWLWKWWDVAVISRLCACVGLAPWVHVDHGSGSSSLATHHSSPTCTSGWISSFLSSLLTSPGSS